MDEGLAVDRRHSLGSLDTGAGGFVHGFRQDFDVITAAVDQLTGLIGCRLQRIKQCSLARIGFASLLYAVIIGLGKGGDIGAIQNSLALQGFADTQEAAGHQRAHRGRDSG